MEKMITVNIPEEVSKEIEFLFHKYNSLMAIIVYLQENNKASEEYIDKKIDDLTYLHIDLEQKKTYYSEKYKPNNIINFNYTFDFNNNTIIYEVI